MRRGNWTSVLAMVLGLAVSVAWQGCGGDDGGPSARFTGDVSGVSPTQASVRTPSSSILAAVDWMLPSRAHAQSTCPALHLLACASNGRDDAVCRRVDSESCNFDVSIDVLENLFAGGSFFFVDDANGNGREDSGEATATLTNPLGQVCNGSVVAMSDVAIDFLGGSATAAAVVKDPNTCPDTTPGPIATSTPSVLPTQSPYGYGASLHQPPSTMLAFLFGAGALGLILPRRPRR